MEETGHSDGHHIGGVLGGDADDILVVQATALQVLCDANGPAEGLPECYLHTLGVRNLGSVIKAR